MDPLIGVRIPAPEPRPLQRYASSVGTFTRRGARVRTKRLWLLLTTIVIVFGGFVPVIVFSVGVVLTGHPILLPLGVVAHVGAQLGLTHLWNRKWLERRGDLRADERGLWLDDVIVAPRSSLRHGHVLQRDGASYVLLARMFQPVEVVVAHEEEGMELLRAMRLDAPRSVGQFTMLPGTREGARVRAGLLLASLPLILFGSMRLAEGFVPFFAPLFAWSFAVTIWSAHRHVRVSVGADGLHLRQLLSRARFIPFSALRTAELDGQNVHLRLRDGRVETMHHPSTGEGWKPLLYRDRADEGRMLVDRIDARVEQLRGHGAEVALLARGERSTREWLHEVSLASDEHATFRAPALPVDELWRVVEDPALATTARAGAAFALRSRLDDAGRSRLRIAADACAEPKLRAALRRVAFGPEGESLEAVYEGLEDEGPQRRAHT